VAENLSTVIKKVGFDFAAVYPSSSLAAAQSNLERDPTMTTVLPTNEMEGVALCAGAWLGGMHPLLFIENTGFSVASYSLLRLNAAFGIPVVIILDYRGDVGDANWWAVPLGWSTSPLLDALRIPHRTAGTMEEVEHYLPKLRITAEKSLYPTALVLNYGMGELQ
jgi:sulfopyruvate decarboxylase subunit alpha